MIKVTHILIGTTVVSEDSWGIGATFSEIQALENERDSGDAIEFMTFADNVQHFVKVEEVTP